MFHNTIQNYVNFMSNAVFYIFKIIIAEFFLLNSGYQYIASSAFIEARTKVENPLILCGHQHIEAAIKDK